MSSRQLTSTAQCIFTACILAASQLAWAGDEPTVVRLSEPVEVTDTHETFGAAIPTVAEPVSLSMVVAQHADYADKSVTVDARVSKVCQKKGCFFIAKDGDSLMLTMLQGHVFWADTVEHLGRPELATDPRFATPEAFSENMLEAREELGL